MATLSEYFTALQNSVTEQGHTFPLFTDDFFPYTSNWFNPKSDRFFTGFYASREVCANLMVLCSHSNDPAAATL